MKKHIIISISSMVLVLIVIGSMLFLYLYGMGNHEKEVFKALSKNEKELTDRLKKEYKLIAISKIEVVPKDNITKILRGSSPFRYELKLYSDTLQNNANNNRDSLRIICLDVAKKFHEINSTLSFVQIEFIDKSKNDFDSIQYFSFTEVDYK